MAEYSHVVVVMSMVLGLSVTQLLKGIAQLYRTRTRVRPYWLHTAWLILLVLFSFLVWWTYWNYRGIEEWNFFRFVMYLSPPIVFYFLTAIAVPDPSDAVVDLREYFFANRGGFFGTFGVYAVMAGLTAMLVRGLPLLDPSNLFRLGLVLVTLVGLRSASERVHRVLFIIAAGAMLMFVLLFQLRLG